MNDGVYLVAGTKPWNRRAFAELSRKVVGSWHYAGVREEFTLERVRSLRPKYIFFLHWSWKVPLQIVDEFECVCFHMTDVPYGRGGSPLQNLILRGHTETRITALRMTAEFDAGPIYLKRPLALHGTAEEILARASDTSVAMIEAILTEQPVPKPQQGTATIFQRRKPEESAIPSLPSLGGLHDFIRMLDGEGYPRAFLEYGGFRYTFFRACLYDGRIVADVNITPIEPK